MGPTPKTDQPDTSGGIEQARRRLVWVMLLRVGLTSALLGATMVLNFGSVTSFRSPSPAFLLGLIAFTYAATIVYSVWYRTRRGVVLLAWLQLAVDAVLWGGLAYATGGIASGFTFLFDLWVIVAAVVLGGRAAFVSATVSSAVLLALAAAMGQGWLPPLADQLDVALPTRTALYFLGVNVTALFVVAALVSSLVARLERTGRGLERERAIRADLSALHADIVRSLSVGLATVGPEGEVLTMNPSGKAILGVEEKESEACLITRWFPQLELTVGPEGGDLVRGHCVGVASDGRKVPLELTVTPLLGAEGGRRGTIVAFNDLTKMRRLEAALERARKLAALGELAASLAHEIRNPLSAVSGSFQMLAASPGFSEEDRSLSEIIARELERMERLVNDMLEYARPNEPRRHAVDVGRVVSEVARAFLAGREAEGRNVHVYTQDDLTAPVDQSQLRQVLWNLLRNAAQATDEGGSIEVAAGRGEDGSVVLEVADDGVGIAGENVSRVFDPFFTTRERGLGLGLAICRRIIEGHGGTIEVAPAEGRGSVFRVALPAAEGSPGEP